MVVMSASTRWAVCSKLPVNVIYGNREGYLYLILLYKILVCKKWTDQVNSNENYWFPLLKCSYKGGVQIKRGKRLNRDYWSLKTIDKQEEELIRTELYVLCSNKDFTSRTTHWMLINGDKAHIAVWKSLDYGQWHRQGSRMQGQMISLVVNVAYMHHWAKPSQTGFRRSAIWRWPLAYSDGPGLHKMWSSLSYSNSAAHQIECNVYRGYFCHVASCIHPGNADKLLMPTSKMHSCPLLSLYLISLPLGT